MNFYDLGLEAVTDVDGWAVFSGCDGEDPRFVSFHVDESDACECVRRMKSDPERSDDVAAELAVLTSDMGVVSANDFELQTHEQLRARIEQARAAGLADELR
ncbi:MAG TPA: hypothetical protein VH062_02000 [Polyangiaceae bacterium]|jgi:hypothetical protein|nr:hypothetical protein [Polyangiaceae bacterium]